MTLSRFGCNGRRCPTSHSEWKLLFLLSLVLFGFYVCIRCGSCHPLCPPLPSLATPSCPPQCRSGPQCLVPSAGARSQLLGWLLHPTAHGHQGCCLGKPGPATGACCRLRVGATALGPHSKPVLRSQCHHSLYWEEPALRCRGVAVESLFMILCYIIGVLFSLQISLIPAVLSARMARRRWVLCVRNTLSWLVPVTHHQEITPAGVVALPAVVAARME